MPAPKTAPKPPVDPFADLFANAEVEEKRGDRRDPNLHVPQYILDAVKDAFDRNVKKTIAPKNAEGVYTGMDIDTYRALRDLLATAGDRMDDKVSVRCVSKYDGESDDERLVGLSYTVGKRIGGGKRKNATSDAVAE